MECILKMVYCVDQYMYFITRENAKGHIPNGVAIIMLFRHDVHLNGVLPRSMSGNLAKSVRNQDRITFTLLLPTSRHYRLSRGHSWVSVKQCKCYSCFRTPHFPTKQAKRNQWYLSLLTKLCVACSISSHNNLWQTSNKYSQNRQQRFRQNYGET